jgi:hypothetical protein
MYHRLLRRVMTGEAATLYLEAMGRLHGALERKAITLENHASRMRSLSAWVRERGHVVLPEDMYIVPGPKSQ